MGIVAFSVVDVNIYWYGLVWAAAVLGGMFITGLNVRLRQESFSPVLDILLLGMPLGLILARTGYVMLHWELYQNEWSSIFKLWQGGFFIYGAVAGFVLAAVLYSHLSDRPLWHWLDILLPAIIAGLMIVQVGNFAAQSTVGVPLPNNLPNDHTLVEYIEYGYRPSGFENYEYFKPVALYQAAVLAAILCGMIFLSWRQIKGRTIPSGAVFLLGMILLASTRFFCGFMYLSADKTGGLHLGQIICLLVVVLCGAMLFFRCRRSDWQKNRLYV